MHGFKQGWIPLLAGMFFCLCVNTPVGAGPITFEFAGEVTFIGDEDNVLGDGVSLGSPFSGSFTFESTTPDVDPSQQLRAIYEDTITDVSGLLADLAFSGPIGGGNFIALVLDGFFGTSSDEYTVRSGIELLGQPARFRLTLVDGTGTAFSDDSLLIDAPDPVDFERATFNLFSEASDFSFSVGGELTALIPEPMTVVLLGVGAAFLITRRPTHPERVRTRVRENSRSD